MLGLTLIVFGALVASRARAHARVLGDKVSDFLHDDSFRGWDELIIRANAVVGTPFLKKRALYCYRAL